MLAASLDLSGISSMAFQPERRAGKRWAELAQHNKGHIKGLEGHNEGLEGIPQILRGQDGPSSCSLCYANMVPLSAKSLSLFHQLKSWGTDVLPSHADTTVQLPPQPETCLQPPCHGQGSSGTLSMGVWQLG